MVSKVVWLPGWSFGSEVSEVAGLPNRAEAPDVTEVCDFSTCRSEGDFFVRARQALDRVATPVVVIGWSLGAMVALELAASEPERITRLALIGATARFIGQDGQPARVVQRMRSKLATDSNAVVRDFDRRANITLVRQRPWTLDALDAGLDYLLCRSHEEAARAITVPATLFHSQDDAIVPVAAARHLANVLPRSELTVLDTGGHAPFHTRPIDFAAWLASSRS